MSDENIYPETNTIISMDDTYVMHSYGRKKVVFVKGSGMKLWDADGKEYLDFLAGIAVNGIGHSHPELAEAICRQSSKLMHVSNLFYVPQQPMLAKKLVELSGLDKAFFCNSGAEANEAALKLARKWGNTKRSGRYEIITAKHSFHGRTLAAVTATGQPKYHSGFEPMMPGFKYVPYNDFDALKKSISDATCAVMLEPVQGESGVWPASKEYMVNVRKLCDDLGILLILDEVQTGIGRTGKWFGFQHYDIKPDIMTLAKTLGGGFPIGSCLATNSVAEVFEPGSHASTFGGNPLACTAALTTIDIIEKNDLINNSMNMGAYMKESLIKLQKSRNDIKDVRGLGLMIALEFNRDDIQDVVVKCMNQGLIVNGIGTNIIRFVPPLIVNQNDIDNAINILANVL